MHSQCEHYDTVCDTMAAYCWFALHHQYNITLPEPNPVSAEKTLPRFGYWSMRAYAWPINMAAISAAAQMHLQCAGCICSSLGGAKAIGEVCPAVARNYTFT